MNQRSASPHNPDAGCPWWQRFFESPDAFEVGLFPDERETDAEVAGLIAMLGLQAPMRVADICCGAGRHLVRLAAAGLRMVGVDYSAMMIRCSREAVAAAGVPAHLIRADARDLPLRSECCDATINMFNSFGYMDDAGNERIVHEMARCLKPGGLFFLDTRNRQFQILFAPYRLHLTLPGDVPAVVGSRYCSETKRLDTTWRDPQEESRVYHHASIRLYGLDELDEIVAGAGLERVAVYGSFEGEPFDGFQRQLLYVARKPR